MSYSVNRVMLLGMVGKDAEIRRFNNGGQVANFSVATEESWKDKSSGEWKKKTDWHNVAVFSENLCLIAEKYVKKGSKVYIEGKLVTRKWSKDGKDHYATEVVLQGFDCHLELITRTSVKDAREEASANGGRSSSRDDGESMHRGANPSASSGGPARGGDLDDDIPF